MSDLRFESHLPDEDLLIYLDGEMGLKKAAACRAHLEHCWHCQMRAAALQKTIQSFVHFLYEDYSAQLPDPPNQWRGFDRKLRQLQTASERPLWVRRFSQRFKLWRPMLAGSGAAVAALAALFLFADRPQKLSAAEILRRVMTAETPKNTLQSPLRKRVFQSQPRRLPQQAAHVLESNHFDLQNVLSGSSFAAWRDSLKEKEDVIAENGGLLTLSTKPRQDIGEWQIVEATLTVRSEDFYPVRETFTFSSAQGPQIVEFSELESPEPPPVLDATAAGATPKSSRRDRVSPPITKQLPKASPALELNVLSRIHSVGADLGQEAAVSRTPENVLAVNSVVEHVKRKQQILAALAPFQQNSSIRFNILTAAEAQQSRLPAQRISRMLVVNASPSEKSIPAGDALLGYLSAQGVAGPELTTQIQRFSEEVVRHSNAALLHSLALQDFVARFSPNDVHSFPELERGQWRQVICDHAEAIADNTAALRAQLAPVYGKAAGYGESVAAAKPMGLLPLSANLLALVKSQDEIVNAAFTLSNEGEKASSINGPAFWRSLSEVQDSARQVKSSSTP